MLQKDLMTLISKGETEETIKLLLDFISNHTTRFAQEVYLISSRFNMVSSEMRKGVLPHSDYELEMNSINKSLLEIITSLDGVNEEIYKKKKSIPEIEETVRELIIRFDKSRKNKKTIISNPTRLREKNEITRELGKIFINYPELIESYFETIEEGIIVGVAHKYKTVPDLSGIDFFESIKCKELGNFTKCCIANAIAEIVYSGLLRIGDDKRITKILEDLFPNSFQTVKISITRVSAELDYFLGNILSVG